MSTATTDPWAAIEAKAAAGRCFHRAGPYHSDRPRPKEPQFAYARIEGALGTWCVHSPTADFAGDGLTFTDDSRPRDLDRLRADVVRVVLTFYDPDGPPRDFTTCLLGLESATPFGPRTDPCYLLTFRKYIAGEPHPGFRGAG